jgi:RNA polymerase sigma-70 factor (ECF subfamily)
MDAPDEHLVARTAYGDRAAFAVLYDRHAPRVSGLLRQLIPEPAAAEDVLQETFWQVWARSARAYDPGRSSVTAWLLAIARSRAIDALRRRTPSPGTDDLPALPCPGPGPAERAERVEEADRLHAALHDLPAAQRQAVSLAFLAGLTHPEIAASLGVPLGTVKTRIRLGLLRLRDALPVGTGSA